MPKPRLRSRVQSHLTQSFSACQLFPVFLDIQSYISSSRSSPSDTPAVTRHSLAFFHMPPYTHFPLSVLDTPCHAAHFYQCETVGIGKAVGQLAE